MFERYTAHALQQGDGTTESIEALRNDFNEFKAKTEFNINLLAAHYEALADRFDDSEDEMRAELASLKKMSKKRNIKQAV